jgi:methylmalonyl-CoA mutase N-terminal domain/subunit
VLGGTQSLHANSFDEALALPTERAAKIALRTQQIIAAEAGVVETADPLGGSWFVEHLTREVEERARDYLRKIEDMGGAVKAIEYMQAEIESSAYDETMAIEAKERIVVGVNEYVEKDETSADLLRVSAEIQHSQIERVRAVRGARDQAAVDDALAALRDAAKGTDNLLLPMKEALRRMATVGEVCGTLREIFGMYRPR